MLEFLGPVEEFKGAQVANVGEWLVVFKNNAPVRLFSVGQKVRKLINAPAMGATVARLATAPQPQQVTLTDVSTRDGFVMSSITFEVDVRLTPENPPGEDKIISLILAEGHNFNRGLTARLSSQVSEHVRTSLMRIEALEITRRGPLGAVFPGGHFDLENDLLTVTGIRLISWTKAAFSEAITTVRQQAVAEEMMAQDRKALLDSEARVNRLTAQHAAEAKRLEHEENLRLKIEEARALGWEPAALAQPEMWRQMNEDNRKIAEKLLESPHAIGMLRTNPALGAALISRLTGRHVPDVPRPMSPMARQVDMVLDVADPQRIYSTHDDGSWTGQASDAVLDDAYLCVNPLVEDIWLEAGGNEKIAGAGLAVRGGRAAAILAGAGTPPTVPSGFEKLLAARLSTSNQVILKVALLPIAGASMREVISGVLASHPGPAAMTATTSVRRVSGQNEILVQLFGDAQAFHSKVMDPAYPLVPAIENLTNDQVRLRLALGPSADKGHS